MTLHGDGDKKIWMTELGAPTSTTTDEGVSQKHGAPDAVTTCWPGLRTTGYSGPAFIYSVRDVDTANQDHVDNFGALLTTDWQAKYAAAVLPPHDAVDGHCAVWPLVWSKAVGDGGINLR